MENISTAPKRVRKSKSTEVTTEKVEAVLDMAVAVLETPDVSPEVVDATVEGVVELLDAVSEASASEVVEPVAETEAQPAGTFDEIMAKVTDEEAIAKAVEIGQSFDQRSDFEKAGGNENIQKSLKSSREKLATPRAARVMIACQVDPAIINRSVHDGKRYNVYALGKLADAIHALSGGQVGNKINNAVMRSLFACRKASIPFTGELAKACASDKQRLEGAVKNVLVRHTVSSATASTQASSTMQALTTLGITKRVGGKNATYELSDLPVVAKLEAVLAA